LTGSINVVLDATRLNDLRMTGLPGTAHLALANGVVHLNPASAVFEAMLEGWATQQRARFLKDSTIGPRLELVRRFAAFTNQYPWQWEPAEGRGVLYPLAGRGFHGQELPEHAAAVLRLCVRCSLRVGEQVPGAVRVGAAADP